LLDPKTLRHITQNGIQSFAAGRVLDGIAALRTLLPYCTTETIVCAETETLEKNYHYMLSFLRKGGDDEKRSEVQEKIRQQGVTLLEQANRAIRLSLNDDQYSKALADLQNTYGLSDGLQEKVLEAFQSSPFTGDLEGVRQDDLFDLLWTSPIWSAQDTARWYDFLLRQRDMVQQHLAGAVFLSLCEHYNSEKMQLLNLLADSECRRTRITAIAYLLLLRLRHKELAHMMPPLPDSLCSRKGRKAIAQVQYEMLLMLLSEKDMKQEVEEAEGITKKVISGLTSALFKGEGEKSDSPILPEKAENKKGEALDAIKDMVALRGRYLRNRLQRGLDVNLSKIPLLHHCEYMHRVSHWFLPFDKTHPLFQTVMIDKNGNEKQNLSTLVDLILDCDVDKLATLYLFAKDKDFSKAAQQLDDQGLPDIEDAVIPEYTFRFLMQDLYRFFGHSPLHTQLANPFREKKTLLDFPDLAALFSAEDYISCCRLLYELGRTEQALALLDDLIKREGASAAALLLKGQILTQLQRYTEATACLRNAELLQPDDADILRYLAECCAALHRFEEELEYLQRLAELFPDDETYRRLIPMTLVKAGRNEEALQLFFKLDLEMSEDDKEYPNLVSRIADTAFAVGKLDIAERYTEKNEELSIKHEESFQTVKWEGHLRMGHIKLLRDDWKGCIDHYEQFINFYCKETGKDAKVAFEVLNADWSNRQMKNGQMVNVSDLLLIHDILQAAIESPKA